MSFLSVLRVHSHSSESRLGTLWPKLPGWAALVLALVAAQPTAAQQNAVRVEAVVRPVLGSYCAATNGAPVACNLQTGPVGALAQLAPDKFVAQSMSALLTSQK
jgi:hypothetical protein